MIDQKLCLEVSPATRAAVECLSRAEHGDVVPWPTLTTAMKRDAQSQGRSNVFSARRILLREGFVFRADGEGLGLVRLTPDQVARVAHQRLRKANRQARYGLKEQATMTDSQYAALDRDRQMDYLTGQALLNALKSSTSHHAVREHRQKVAGTQVPNRDTLRE